MLDVFYVFKAQWLRFMWFLCVFHVRVHPDQDPHVKEIKQSHWDYHR